jgi:hypothetical protein
MKVLVCGSREWTNRDAIWRELKKLPAGTIIVHGAARGADQMAGEIGRLLGFEVRPYPADWGNDGKAAGPIRNSRMLSEEHPDKEGVYFDRVLAFAVDFAKARGTTDMMGKARVAGIHVEPFSL